MNCPRCRAELTPAEIATLNAQRSASMRQSARGGRPVTCQCGKPDCRTCRKREQMRRYRTKKGTR